MLDTDSRAVAPGEAYERTRLAALQVARMGFKHVYKKLDSTLRGNLGAEIDAVADAISVDCIIVAPAYPKIGRTTRNGIHYVNDVRIDRTETAKDPKSPVAEADLVKLLASQSQRQAGLLPLEALRAARKPLACESGSCFGAASKSSYATPSRTRICGESPTSRRQAWDECYGQARPVSRNACRIRSRSREAAERTSTCRASSPKGGNPCYWLRTASPRLRGARLPRSISAREQRPWSSTPSRPWLPTKAATGSSSGAARPSGRRLRQASTFPCTPAARPDKSGRPKRRAPREDCRRRKCRTGSRRCSVWRLPNAWIRRSCKASF